MLRRFQRRDEPARLDWREVRLEDIGGFVAWLRLPSAGRDGRVAILRFGRPGRRLRAPAPASAQAEFVFMNPAWEVTRAAHEPMINFGMHSA
jgi:hypothetical protein